MNQYYKIDGKTRIKFCPNGKWYILERLSGNWLNRYWSTITMLQENGRTFEQIKSALYKKELELNNTKPIWNK